jgi:hypothetical protein
VVAAEDLVSHWRKASRSVAIAPAWKSLWDAPPCSSGTRPIRPGSHQPPHAYLASFHQRGQDRLVCLASLAAKLELIDYENAPTPFAYWLPGRLCLPVTS